MRFLILSHHAGSPHHGMVFRNYAWAQSLKSLGHDVTIIASAFSHVRTHQPEIQGWWQTEMIDGVRYIWIKNIAYEQADRFKRLASMALFFFSIYFYMRRILRLDGKKFDVVVASSPHPFVVYPAHKIAKRMGAKFIFDIRDLWPLSLIELGDIKPSHPFIRMVQHAEDYACRHCDIVTAVPHNCENYLKSRGLTDGKFMAFSNGFSEQDLQENSASSPLPDTHKKILDMQTQQDKVLVGYAGALGVANGLQYLVQAIAACDENTKNKIACILIGKGEYTEKLQLLIREKNLQSHVFILPPIDKGMIPDFLKKIDICYLGLEDKPLFRMGVSPTKLTDYMLAKKPVLYAVNDEHNPIINSGGGSVAAAGDIQSIATSLHTLVKMDKNTRLKMGHNGYDWLMENYSVDKQIKKLLLRLQD